VRALIACEFSGAVRDAFTSAGHYARSVDLLPTEALSQPVYFRGDFGCESHASYDAECEECEYGEPWCHRCDAFAYECPCLGPTEDEAEYADDCEEGARHLSGDLFTVEDIDGYDLLIAHPPCTFLTVAGARWFKGREQQQADAIAFCERVWNLPVPRIALENPIGVLSTRSSLGKPTQIIQPWQFGHGETKATCLWLKGLPKLTPTDIVDGRVARVHMASPGPNRWKERSRTLPGIARAMASQWSVSARECAA
jgi:hypothetical protein